MNKITFLGEEVLRLSNIAVHHPEKIFRAFIVFFTQGPKGVYSKVQRQDILDNYGGVIHRQYQDWIKKNYPSNNKLMLQKRESNKFTYKPKISLITPTYNTPEKFLRECIESVLNQSYQNWELCLVDDNSTKEYVRDIILEYAGKDKRIKYLFRDTNGHISEASNSALEISTGEFVGILDHDDILWPNALYEVAKVLQVKPQAKLIYSDEDKLNENGITHSEPFFKPDWSPDFLRSCNYITHFCVMNKKVIQKVGGFRKEYDGAQDWDLFIRITNILESRKARINSIIHIPTILYSWRKSSTSTSQLKVAKKVKMYAFENQKHVLEDDLKQRQISGKVLPAKSLGFWRVTYDIQGSPLVSIIIPTKNQYEYIERCLGSIFEKTTYKNFEVVVVDTGSTDEQVWNLYEEYKKKIDNFKVVEWKHLFNFSAVCNFGVEHSKGNFLLFLNNDTEIKTSSGWIENMLEHAQRSEIGAVGCKLLFPNGRLQHIGVVLGISGGVLKRGVAGHPLKNFYDKQDKGAEALIIDSIRNYSAVTAACIMVSREKFLEVSGFEEKLRVAFNDVDFCLKLLKLGYYNIYTPYTEVFHYESVSVGKVEKRLEEFFKEADQMYKKWEDLLERDPYYNKNFTLKTEEYSLAI